MLNKFKLTDMDSHVHFKSLKPKMITEKNCLLFKISTRKINTRFVNIFFMRRIMFIDQLPNRILFV